MIYKRLWCVLWFLFSAFTAYGWNVEPCAAGKISTSNTKVLNIVFCPLDYADSSKFKEDISSITARLGSAFPFCKFNGFRFFLLIFDGQKSDDIFTESEIFPYLKIRNDFIQELKNKIGGNYKLVILNKQGNVSGAELSNVKATSIIILGKSNFGKKNRLAKAFLHEFGHSLGLREESAAAGQAVISGEPNCAPDKQTAAEWWGDIAGENNSVGYFEFKAGGKTYIKPTLRSIMNDPFKSYGYGPVNERYLCGELGVERKRDAEIK